MKPAPLPDRQDLLRRFWSATAPTGERRDVERPGVRPATPAEIARRIKVNQAAANVTH